MDVVSVNRAFHVLCRAGVRLSGAFSIFGFWLVVYLTSKLVWDGFWLCSYLIDEAEKNNVLNQKMTTRMMFVVSALLSLLLVCWSVDLPAHQVRPCVDFMVIGIL